jgi:hypothetical protein
LRYRFRLQYRIPIIIVIVEAIIIDNICFMLYSVVVTPRLFYMFNFHNNPMAQVLLCAHITNIATETQRSSIPQPSMYSIFLEPWSIYIRVPTVTEPLYYFPLNKCTQRWVSSIALHVFFNAVFCHSARK